MADLFNPSSPQHHQQQGHLESDDISSLLHTLLHNSSQPSTSSHQLPRSTVFDSSSGSGYPFGGGGSVFFGDRSDVAFPGSIDGNGIGDVDCESEEPEETPANPVPGRSSSKRSRAAEVHNLSEKRRRQKINEKMKALQKLIPNSNKTDKASMLDEAIEYLKQLQLQVQMLTMRNGSSLHPFYLPQSAQPPAQVAPLFAEANTSIVGSFPANEEASLQPMFDPSSKSSSSDYKLLMTRMSELSNSGPSFILEQSVHANYRSFNAAMPSKAPCKNPSLPQLQLDMSHCGQRSSSGVSS